MELDPILDTMPGGFLSFADDGRIIAANQTLLELVGLTKQDIAGQHLEKILTVASRIFHQTHFFPLLKMSGRADEIYLSLSSASGEEVPVLVNGVRVQLKD
jgi:sigma-B regulation protein RsbU (phosphoserine phosphatase)